ncbi:hypothetical protein SAMD00079811_45520 [Scytonema sp. HK-05]|nr:hypothetical protein NIES2130_13950 [Scytonema sp. HK-05]BAY46936.1 hypothetical protein SAMD00079811_45520 [Scytonema sp. HK-05]
MGGDWLSIMKEARLSLRISTRRLNKLRLYAANRDKTITQIVEDWVDRLPNTESDKNSGTLSRAD